MSESEKCLSVGKNFSRREWLMLILILLMLEGGVLFSSHALMSETNVLNYISFASTIASLILAVLAIVYGFYQSESQKRTGDGIELHLSNIRSTTDEMRSVSNGLMNSSKEFLSLSDKLNGLNTTLSATHDRIANLEGGIEGMHQKQEQFSMDMQMILKMNESRKSAKEGSVGTDFREVRTMLVEQPTFPMNIIAFSFYYLFKNKADEIVGINAFVNKLSEYLGDEKNLLGLNKSNWSTVLVIFISIFVSMGLMRNVRNAEGSVAHIGLVKGSWDLLEQSIGKFENSAYFSALGDGMKPIIELIPTQADFSTTPA